MAKHTFTALVALIPLLVHADPRDDLFGDYSTFDAATCDISISLSKEDSRHTYRVAMDEHVRSSNFVPESEHISLLDFPVPNSAGEARISVNVFTGHDGSLLIQNRADTLSPIALFKECTEKFIQLRKISPAQNSVDAAPRITIIDSATETLPLLAKPGTYLGEKFVFENSHHGDVSVKVGVWESGIGESTLVNFPFTEYVLMISGEVEVVETDDTRYVFEAGDTFVIPKGWTGIWNVRQRMKKQIVRVGDAPE
ncbi:MAG: cupin domain-containing protein [Pseudomonadota bacterium]